MKALRTVCWLVVLTLPALLVAQWTNSAAQPPAVSGKPATEKTGEPSEAAASKAEDDDEPVTLPPAPPPPRKTGDSRKTAATGDAEKPPTLPAPDEPPPSKTETAKTPEAKPGDAEKPPEREPEPVPSPPAKTATLEKAPPPKPEETAPSALSPKAARIGPVKPAVEPVEAKLPAGNRVPDSENSCIECHARLTEKDQTRFLIQIKDFAVDAHWQKGVRCQDCHGGDPTVFEIKAHQSGSEEFRAVKTPADVPKICGNCHKQQALDLVKGVHHAAGPKDKRGVGTILACSRCHADREQQPSHHILPLHDKKSPVFLDNQVKTCGGCHEEFLNTYMKSVHGEGMAKLGLLVTPGCADCHGAHGVYHANDTRSTLHSTNVAATCGKCHRFIEERLQASVHGHGAGGPASKPAPGGNSRLKPSCTNCHQGHDIVDPQSLTFRVNLPNRCGNCHANYSSRYAMSLHGALTALGYGPGAKCSDCHGAHDILPTDDPHSRLSGANRVETCRKCHPYANANFSRFDPHADHKDFETNPVLHVAFVGMELLLFSVFGVFGVHTILWFARSLIHTLRHGRPKKLRPGQQAYLRFEPIHRVLHVVVIVSFLGLALTGLPLKYHEQEWGKTLASALGGFDSTSALHRLCALATVFYASAHLVWLCKKIAEMRRQGAHWMTVVFGPDSPVPNFRDVKDFFCMLGWFFGLKKKPVFERWSYWEKFDYWAVFWGVGIIGTSGLMLWFPNFFTLVLPGWALNVAKLIHSEEALLATGFIFAIHFFNTHLRADKFPIDPVIFTGAISEEELHEERPEYFDRVKREGRLGQIRTTMPSRAKLWFILLGGATALTIGTGLLVAMVLAGLRH